MEIRTSFNNGLKDALKSKDQVAMSTIRLIMAALKDRDIAARSKGNNEGIDNTEILSMLQSMIKQRNDSIKMYTEGGRQDLAEREEAEIKVIQTFLPTQLSDDDVAAAIDEAIKETQAETIRDMGKVMGILKTKYAGQIDMGKVGGLVKEKLG